MKRKSKMIALTLGLIMTASMFSGCKKDAEDIELSAGESMFEVKDDLSVAYSMVESFSSKNYKIDDLKKAVNQEVSDFNENYAKTKDSLTLSSLEKTGENVKLVYQFASQDEVENYLEAFEKEDEDGVFFAGTCKDAKKAGYTPESELTDTEGKESVSAETAMGEEEMKVVVTSRKTKVYVDGDVQYLTDGATYDDGVVTTKKGMNYIFYK